jgi:outer membrane protein assembly factor BamA
MSVGIGYRRSDLWRERIGFRTTARGTLETALLFDFELDFQSFRTERTFVNFYTKYEGSPQMDFYGQGSSSVESSRTSYLLDDLAADMNAGFEIFKSFRAGLTGGVVRVHTGSGKRGGVPSTEEIFPPEEVPGLGEDTTFLRWGGFLAIDYRDSRDGPRSGGVYGARFRRYSDRDLNKYSFRQTEFELQQYIPYFNKTRVIALRLATVLSFPKEGERIPFYMQPTLGGNDDLRGFARYRFYDDHSIFASVEHRWHAFAGLDMAIFVDAGKVVSRKAEIDFTDLEYAYGIGFRFRLQDAVFMRIDFAGSREGFRFMWTFSDIFRIRY